MGTKLTDKQRDYEAAMAKQNGAARVQLCGDPDPFGDYSLTDFQEEVQILEALAPVWKMRFCQATMGHVRRAGGLWIAYDDGGTPKSVLHVERFIGKSTELPQVNFWAETVHTGLLVAERYKLPFVIVAAFNDGRFAVRFDMDPEYVTTIGCRVGKGPNYPQAVNLVSYFDIEQFVPMSKKSREQTT